MRPEKEFFVWSNSFGGSAELRASDRRSLELTIWGASKKAVGMASIRISATSAGKSVLWYSSKCCSGRMIGSISCGQRARSDGRHKKRLLL